jgi:hypothetical protein
VGRRPAFPLLHNNNSGVCCLLAKKSPHELTQRLSWEESGRNKKACNLCPTLRGVEACRQVISGLMRGRGDVAGALVYKHHPSAVPPSASIRRISSVITLHSVGCVSQYPVPAGMSPAWLVMTMTIHARLFILSSPLNHIICLNWFGLIFQYGLKDKDLEDCD